MMGTEEASSSRRRFRLPLAGTGHWVWAVMGAAFLVCAALVWFQKRQVERSEQTLLAIRELRNARLDLAKGLLHLAESDAPGSPFSREQGLALLWQAMGKLSVNAFADGGVVTDSLRTALTDFERGLETWPADGIRDPGRAAEMRAVFHAVEREADAMDARLRRRLQIVAEDNRREFAWVATSAVVLLGLFCFALLVLRRRGARAARATREAEQRFAAVLENLGEGLILADSSGRLLHCNRAALEMHEFGDIDRWREAVAKFADMYALETPEGKAVTFVQWPLQRILRGESVRTVELRLRRVADGWTRVFSYGGGLLAGVDGERFAFITITDVTARSEAEHALRVLNAELEGRVERRTAELEAKNRELEMFTYSVSHDLKAPLRGIDGYSRLLLEDYSDRLDDEGRRFLGSVRQAASHMGQLIDDLLSYSRLERRTPQPAMVRPGELVRALLAGLAGEIESRGVTILDTVPDDLVLCADAQGFTMALRNLLDNALKFTRRRTDARIEIGARTEGGRGVLWVRDNGIGFDMRFVERIFDIFQRLHRAEDYPGTGIGLAIVRKAMERTGGRAWAESAPGQGAVFYLEAPLFK
ncbi:MAG: PAS domain-containing protein [Burkholderiales bacterium]|nr:PAS domain-containing protein [Opitutaceae bacterium]